MSLEQTSTTNEEILLKELKYEISPGASYLLQKEQVRWQATGSNIYKSASGQRIIRFNLSAAAPVFLNPQSARLMFTVVNNDANLPLQPVTGPWGFPALHYSRQWGSRGRYLFLESCRPNVLHDAESKHARQRSRFGGWGVHKCERL